MSTPGCAAPVDAAAASVALVDVAAADPVDGAVDALAEEIATVAVVGAVEGLDESVDAPEDDVPTVFVVAESAVEFDVPVAEADLAS